MQVVGKTHALTETRLQQFQFVLTQQAAGKFAACILDVALQLDVEALDAAQAAREVPGQYHGNADHGELDRQGSVVRGIPDYSGDGEHIVHAGDQCRSRTQRQHALVGALALPGKPHEKHVGIERDEQRERVDGIARDGLGSVRHQHDRGRGDGDGTPHRQLAARPALFAKAQNEYRPAASKQRYGYFGDVLVRIGGREWPRAGGHHVP